MNLRPILRAIIGSVVVSGCAAVLATFASCSSSHPAVQRSSNDAPAPNPYPSLPHVPSFRVLSTTVTNGRPLPTAQLSGLFKVPGGKDISPQLSWSGFPKRTKSFVVSMYDPQAPTGSGFWHWIVANIPATTTALPVDAGAPNSTLLPAGAIELGGDAGMHRYVGGAPPAGSGVHEYTITVSALDTPTSGVGSDASGAFLGFTIAGHTIARATLICPTELG